MVFSCFLLPLSCQILSDQHQEIADTAIPGQGHLIQDHTIQGPHDIIIVQGCLLQGHHLHVDITGHVTETDMVFIYQCFNVKLVTNGTYIIYIYIYICVCVCVSVAPIHRGIYIGLILVLTYTNTN